MNRPNTTTCPRERGFTLIELAIATALAGLLAAYGVWVTMQQLAHQRAEAQGDLMLAVNDASKSYMTRYFQELIAGQAVSGVGSPMSPTVTELKSLGFLDASFSSNSLYGSSYRVAISKVPSSCIPPACGLQGLTYLNAPILRSSGAVDYVALGTATTKIGGSGGFSDTSSPSLIRGFNSSWTVNNPAGSAAGILVAKSAYASQGFDEFLRRDGTLPVTGDIQMGSNDILNAGDVKSSTVQTTSVSSATVAATSNISAGGSISATQSVNGRDVYGANSLSTNGSVYGNSVYAAASVSTSGNLYAGNNVTSDNANFRVLTTSQGATIGGRVSVAEYVALGGGPAAPGAGCWPDGLVAVSSAGGVVSCLGGVWTENPSKPKTAAGAISGAGNLGAWDFCALGRGGNLEDSHYCRVFPNGDGTWEAKGYKCGGLTANCVRFQ